MVGSFDIRLVVKYSLVWLFFCLEKMIEALLRAHSHLDYLMAQAICSAYEAGTLDEILKKADEEKSNPEKEKKDEGGSDKVSVP